MLVCLCVYIYIYTTLLSQVGACSRYRREVHTGFWCGRLRERDYLEDPGIDGWIILRRIFRKWDVGAWTGSSWLSLGTAGGHL